MLNCIEIKYDHMKSKAKENMGELQTTSTNTVLDKVMLQIPLNTKLLLTAISEDNKQPRLQETLHLYTLSLLTNRNNRRLIKQLC